MVAPANVSSCVVMAVAAQRVDKQAFCGYHGVGIANLWSLQRGCVKVSLYVLEISAKSHFRGRMCVMCHSWCYKDCGMLT